MRRMELKKGVKDGLVKFVRYSIVGEEGEEGWVDAK
jgi:hypothetical protein